MKEQLKDLYTRANSNTTFEEFALVSEEYKEIEKCVEALELIKKLLKGKITFDKKSIIIRFNKRDGYQVRIPLKKSHLKLFKEVFNNEQTI